jgi:hypothetical protein
VSIWYLGDLSSKGDGAMEWVIQLECRLAGQVLLSIVPQIDYEDPTRRWRTTQDESGRQREVDPAGRLWHNSVGDRVEGRSHLVA